MITAVTATDEERAKLLALWNDYDKSVNHHGWTADTATLRGEIERLVFWIGERNGVASADRFCRENHR